MPFLVRLKERRVIFYEPKERTLHLSDIYVVDGPGEVLRNHLGPRFPLTVFVKYDEQQDTHYLQK